MVARGKLRVGGRGGRERREIGNRVMKEGEDHRKEGGQPYNGGDASSAPPAENDPDPRGTCDARHRNQPNSTRITQSHSIFNSNKQHPAPQLY
jgi:hypothetical protein